MKYIYILDHNTFSLFCICILAKTKIQKISNKEKIHNEGNINRASAKEQGLLLAGTAGCFSGGDLDQDQVTPFGFFCRQQKNNVIDETVFSEVDEVVKCLQSKAPEEMLLWALVRLWRWQWTV